MMLRADRDQMQTLQYRVATPPEYSTDGASTTNTLPDKYHKGIYKHTKLACGAVRALLQCRRDSVRPDPKPGVRQDGR